MGAHHDFHIYVRHTYGERVDLFSYLNFLSQIFIHDASCVLNRLDVMASMSINI